MFRLHSGKCYLKIGLTILCVVFIVGCFPRTDLSEVQESTSTVLTEATLAPTATATIALVPITPIPILPMPSHIPIPTTDPILLDPAYNPLTGLLVDDPSLLERRPLMIKVSNWPREGRPHAGLASADIVFEYYIGAYMNRFLALYYGQNAEKIGPVRSGRLVDRSLTNLYQGLLVYGDADPAIDEVLIDVLGERALAFHVIPCPAMCGQATHSATGVFANAVELTRYVVDQGIDNIRPELGGMVFSDVTPVGDELGTVVSFVYADFSLTEWRYDPTEGVYHLWQDSEMADGKITKAPTFDRNTGEPLSYENIIIVYSNYITFTPSIHDIEISNVSSFQPALYFRDGVMQYGTWQSADPFQPMQFYATDGRAIQLKPGQTWIIIAGNHTITNQIKPGEWDFYFETP